MNKQRCPIAIIFVPIINALFDDEEETIPDSKIRWIRHEINMGYDFANNFAINLVPRN
jgi:hypothetical protein